MSIRLTALFVLLSGIVFLSSCSEPTAPLVLGGAGSYEGNFHTHTVASDGLLTYHEVISEAVGMGLDFIVITDHNQISTAARMYCPQEEKILCILGEEISTSEGHMLAVGIRKAVPSGLSPEETIELIHEQGGIAIAAHPGEEMGGISSEKLMGLSELDAAECTPLKDSDSYNASCIYTPGLPHVYDSDAHEREDLRRIWDRCQLEELSQAGIKEAVKNKRCEVVLP